MSRSTPTTPANALTPNFTTVSSPGGFSSGDLVYFKDNSFGTIPNNAVASGNFPVVSSVSIPLSPFNGAISLVASSTTFSTGSLSRRGNSAALLTNGNIVVISASFTGGAPVNIYARIVDQNLGSVVANFNTTLDSRFGQASVCALSGGGFAVSSATSGELVNFRIYDNSGNPVTPVTSGAFSSGAYSVTSVGLPNGNFVIVANATGSGPAYQCRVFTPTGTGVAGVTTFASNNNSNTSPIPVAFADSTFSILYRNSSGGLDISNFSSSGALGTSVSAATDVGSINFSHDFVRLSGGNAVFAYIDNGSQFIRYAFFDPLTNTVSGRTTVPSSNANTTVDLRNTSDGGFMVVYNNISTGGLAIRFYNSAGTSIAVTTLSNAAGTTYQGFTQKNTVIEGSNFYTVFGHNPYSTGNNIPFASILQFAKTSPYAVRNTNNQTTTIGLVSAPVNGYVKASATPNSASFFAANTQTLSINIPQSSGTTFHVSPFTPLSEATFWHSLCTMQNGQFVMAYSTTGGAVRFTVFNQSAQVVSTTTVATGVGSNIVRCAVLGNGKLVITYASSNNVFFKVYSTSYSELASGDLITLAGRTAQSPGSPNACGHALTAIDSDTFAIAFTNSSNSASAFSVFSDSGAFLSNTAGNTTYTTAFNIAVGALPNGYLYLSYYANSYGSSYIQYFARGASNSFFDYRFSGIGNGGQNNGCAQGMLSPYGVPALVINDGSTIRMCKTDPYGLQFGYTNLENSVGSAGAAQAQICDSPNGDLMVVCSVGTSGFRYRTYSPNTDNFGANASALMTATDITDSNTSSSMCMAVTCVFGDVYAVAYRNTSGLSRLCLISTSASSYSTSITGGVTVCQPALLPSPSNGYYLAGVSASDCAAGGTGVLQINGTATLNSQYPAGTTPQSFDFNTPALDVGIRGTIAGRNVILSGGK